MASVNAMHCLPNWMLQHLVIQVSQPLTSFRKATETLQSHFFGKDGKGRLSHAQAVVNAEYFKHYMKGPPIPIYQYCDDLYSKQIKENKEKLEAILKVVIFCGHQNIPLRSHRDDSRSISVNKGNFLSPVDFRCEVSNAILTKYLKSSFSQATYYISKSIKVTDSSNQEGLSNVL